MDTENILEGMINEGTRQPWTRKGGMVVITEGHSYGLFDETML